MEVLRHALGLGSAAALMVRFRMLIHWACVTALAALCLAGMRSVMGSTPAQSQTFWKVSVVGPALSSPPLAVFIAVAGVLACSWSSVRLGEWLLC